jgi:hypothetical protein
LLQVMETTMRDAEVDHQSGLFGRVAHWVAARAHAAEELERLSRGDLSDMARDLGLAESELRNLLPRAADNTRLMDAMLRARGLDPEQIARRSAPLMRDLELTCTRCGAVTRCRRELAAGTAAGHCHAFCANAGTMDAILEDAARV